MGGTPTGRRVRLGRGAPGAISHVSECHTNPTTRCTDRQTSSATFELIRSRRRGNAAGSHSEMVEPRSSAAARHVPERSTRAPAEPTLHTPRQPTRAPTQPTHDAETADSRTHAANSHAETAELAHPLQPTHTPRQPTRTPDAANSRRPDSRRRTRRGRQTHTPATGRLAHRGDPFGAPTAAPHVARQPTATSSGSTTSREVTRGSGHRRPSISHAGVTTDRAERDAADGQRQAGLAFAVGVGDPVVAAGQVHRAGAQRGDRRMVDMAAGAQPGQHRSAGHGGSSRRPP